MADWRAAVQAAKAEARRAREDADRLRQEARELEQRLRREAREAAQQGRQTARGARQRERHTTRESRQGARRARQEAPTDTPGATTEFPFETAGLTSLRVKQGAGELVICATGEGESPGLTASGGRTEPKVDIDRSGNELRIEVRGPARGLFRRRNGGRTEVRIDLPLESLSVDLGHGELRLADLEADALKVHCGAGDVRVSDCRGALAVDAGAVGVSIRRHRGLVGCHSGAGDLSVDIAEVAEGAYALEAGLGRADLRLPPDEAVEIEARSGVGRTRIDYPSTAGAATTIRLAAGVGELSVRPRAADADLDQPDATDIAPPQRPRHEAEEMRVLQLLEQGRVTPQEVAELIAALRGAPPPSPPADEDGESPVED